MKKWNWIFILLLIAGGAYWRYWYVTPAHSSGEPAPDFTGYLANGDSIRLSQFKGKKVLLDFWGSWCGPCRRANRDLVAIYNQNPDKFEIISIGIEDNAERWQKAIAQDGLSWKHHISDLRMFDDHVALLYGIRAIPATLLLDEQGHILKVKPTKEQLKALIN